MKNLLITIYLGNMLFSANAMQYDDDYDPSIDVTTFPTFSIKQQVFSDDDYDPSIDVTTFSIKQQVFSDYRFSDISNSNLAYSQKQALIRALTPLLDSNDRVVLLKKNNVPARNSDGEQIGSVKNFAEYVPSWFADKFTNETSFNISSLDGKHAKWIMCYQNPNSGERTHVKHDSR